MTKKNSTLLQTLLMIISFFGIMILQLVVRIAAIKDNYNLYTFIFIILSVLLIFTLASVFDKSRFKTLSFSVPFFVIWLLLGISMTISDITLPKKFSYIGFIFLFIFTGIIVAMYITESFVRDKLFSVIVNGVIISFVAVSIICIVARPYTPGIRYLGLSANPNVFAMYLTSVFICLLTKLDCYITFQVSAIRCIFIYILMGAAFMFLYLTSARTSFLAIMAMCSIWFIFRLILCRKNELKFLRYFIVMIPVAAISFVISFGLLTTVPGMINKPLTFERDRDFLADNGNTKVCYASDTAGDVMNSLEQAADSDESLFKRFANAIKNGDLNVILNGRYELFKDYIKEIGLKGHKKFNRRMNGVYITHAHNNIIQIGYSYGIISMILYIILIIISFIYSVKYYLNKHDIKKQAAFPLLVNIGFFLTTMAECLLVPIQSLMLILFIFSIGETMSKD